MLSCGRGQPLPAVPKYCVGLTVTKIDHFIGFISSPHFVKDVAHRTRTLKVSSGGKTVSMHNVVRNMVAARIIKQYASYCKETGFDYLSERELYRVLQYCSAQQKKALQGLDNISADGLRGVEILVRKLGERGKSSDWVDEVIKLLNDFEELPQGHLSSAYLIFIEVSRPLQFVCSE